MTTRKPERAGPGGPRRGRTRRSALKKKTPSRHDLIEVKFDVEGGTPFIKGTRVPVRAVLGALGDGKSVAKVCRAYRIGRDAVRAALSYAAEVLGREDVIEILGDENLHDRIAAIIPRVR